MNNIHAEKTKDFIHLTGQADTWDEVVALGLKHAKKGSKQHVINDIQVKGDKPSPTIIPKNIDNYLNGKEVDVLIIGGGVVGCAIARELSKNKLNILLVEKEYDVALHASSRNDGMIHPGIDIAPGLLKKKLNNIGNKRYDTLCKELDVPFKRTGQYLCFKKAWQLPLLYLSIPYWNATVSGRAHVLTNKQLHKIEPGISNEAKSALYFDGAGIICPYGLTIALAENAIENGVEISLNTAVTKMNVKNNHIVSVDTNRGTLYPKLVINAAGVFAEEIAKLANDRYFSIHPRKGTNAILDKKTKKNINTIYSLLGTQSKTSHTKGGGIVSTVDGNVLIGPDAIETMDKENFSTNRESIENSFEKHNHAGKWLNTQDIITYFTGIRAATYEEDFIVENGRFTDNIIHAAGIQSPGLTATPAIALKIEELALTNLQKIMDVEINKNFNPVRKGIINPKELSLEERNALIKNNPDYGEIVCRCEEISKGEILDAMRRNLPCATVDGIKRRVRPGMGRCQGGFCGQQVIKLISKEKNLPLDKVEKGYPGSNIFFGQKGGHYENI
ncbi:MAG: NAD(P)/FAD-dependent oxidoreductase [Eubacteriales bacterium]|nr:NAD(P)/FAD-dependent oxidoreductase [Eubacteriales bacterium]